jgi:uroporphyrinogen III methyltransferase / synthase
MSMGGYVYLVGAGPGDLGLLTIKAKECLERADVILYDRLINPLLLEWTKPECEHIYCGKLPKRHIVRQEAINEKLIEYGKQGKVVVRLKGGDPSVFGRVGEEANALDDAGVPYEIIPGITAGIGAATYAGIPVTHREHGASFAVVTGHDKSEDGQPLIDWKALATGIDTIAFYMGVKNLDYISSQLVRHGKPLHTPVVLIQWGTLGGQQTVEGTLETIADRVRQSTLTNPAITLVGEVASLRTQPSWFERKSLFGEQLLFARTSSQSSSIAKELTTEGAEVFEFPRYSTERVESAALDVTKYEDILFLQPESVSAFFKWLRDEKIDLRNCRARFYVRSKKSQEAVEQHGCNVSNLEERNERVNFLIIGEEQWSKKEIELTKTYGKHDFLVSHREVLITSCERTCERLNEEGRLKTIVFPSAESVKAVTKSFLSLGWTPEDLSKERTVICFGPTSKKAAVEAGYKVGATLDTPSKEALIEQLKLFRSQEVIRR